MATDHVAAQRAFRARLATLQVLTTGTMALEATVNGYQRATGSFFTDGFAPGMELTPVGFPQTDPGVVEEVDDLTLKIKGGRTVAAAAGARSLTVGLPTQRRWEGSYRDEEEPEARVPYIEDEWVPGPPPEVTTFPAIGGNLEETGEWIVRWYAELGYGTEALRTPAQKVVELFKAGTTILPGLSVRTKVGPRASAIRRDGALWSVVTITIPWWYRSIN